MKVVYPRTSSLPSPGPLACIDTKEAKCSGAIEEKEKKNQLEPLSDSGELTGPKS